MPKLMIRIIMGLGAVLLSTAPISQTFAQVKQQEAQTSGIAVADTLSNSSATESDNLQLLRPDATAIFPTGDSIPVASAAAMPTPAALSEGATVAIVLVLIVVVVLVVAYLICSNKPAGRCSIYTY